MGRSKEYEIRKAVVSGIVDVSMNITCGMGLGGGISGPLWRVLSGLWSSGFTEHKIRKDSRACGSLSQ